jgi:hypothetical protein
VHDTQTKGTFFRRHIASRILLHHMCRPSRSRRFLPRAEHVVCSESSRHQSIAQCEVTLLVVRYGPHFSEVCGTISDAAWSDIALASQIRASGK